MLGALAALAAAVLASTTASAHIERASYWPNPAPDTGVHPLAGGHVPGARSLYSALRKQPPAGDPEEGEPPISGAGIGLLGAFGTRVEHNRVLGNKPSGDSFVSGGIAVVKGPGGTEPQDDVVRHNRAFGNLPADLVWDGSGTVLFKKNKCATSDPDGLCGGAGGKAHHKRAVRKRG